MGALLQMVGLQKTSQQTESMTQAPSADLIKSDGEFTVPEPSEIKIELEPAALANFIETANICGFGERAIVREKLAHQLKFLGFKIYELEKVNKLMESCVKHASIKLGLGEDLWWYWMDLTKYQHPLPTRVVTTIKNIHSATDGNAVFSVSDILLITSRNQHPPKRNSGDWIRSWENIPMKRRTEICFLRVSWSKDAPVKESFIIDVWRGPTFSDEEAKI